MILADAKGEEYNKLLTDKHIAKFIWAQLRQVSLRHLRAAKARGNHLKLYFAEKAAANLVRQRFGLDPVLKRIKIGFLPPSRPKVRGQHR